MRNSGLKPTIETFLAVLSACASAEAVEEGFLHFESMKDEYGINPGTEHYRPIKGCCQQGSNSTSDIHNH